MTTLDDFLRNEKSAFNAELGSSGGYIKFSNSGKRGEVKWFHMSLETLRETLADIQEHLAEFSPIQKYNEDAWRSNGDKFFRDEVARTTIAVQTKPFFSTLSKLVKWSNPKVYEGCNSDEEIVLSDATLTATLENLSKLINTYTPRYRQDKQDTASRQTIFFGAPGSGKSYRVGKEILGSVDGQNIFRTTFHPDSDYASFVGCYKPTVRSTLNCNVPNHSSTDSEITYAFMPQVFTNAYVHAWQNLGSTVYLVIEEINRGNCAQIFGDLFQLLDRNEDGKSIYPIKADKDLALYLRKELEEEGREGIANENLCLPPNLYLLATMNTSDQSLFPMDSAFKRRWNWEYVPIDYSDKADSGAFEITLEDGNAQKKYRWVEFLKVVNERILEATDSEDKQMGNFFIKHSVGEKEFKSKVMFYLWNEVCKEAYHTPTNFFRALQQENDSELVEFTFNQLFEAGGAQLLLGFMSYLGVQALDAPSETPYVSSSKPSSK